MTENEAELASFLDVLPKLVGAHVDSGRITDPGALRDALTKAGVLDLAVEMEDMGDALHWLTATVETVTRVSPSVGYALAVRYAAQRALPGAGAESTALDATAGFVPQTGADGDAPTATVPWLFEPGWIVLIDADRTAVVPSEEVVALDSGRSHTGLADAQLRRIRLADDKCAGSPLSTGQAIRDADVLVCAVALGIAGAALKSSEEYAAERRQFGAAIGSFAGLRALLAEMRLRVASVQGLLTQALAEETAPGIAAEALAVAGRAAVDVSLEAIQVHGGYGYIEEYPVAGLLRDAISVRARAGGRREILAAVSQHRLGHR